MTVQSLVRVPDDYGSGGVGLNPNGGSRRWPSLASVLQGFYDAITGQDTSDGTAPVYLVRGASTANIADLTAASTSFDGLTLVAGNHVLLKDQTTASQNGIYVVGAVSAGAAPLTRLSTMASGSTILPGILVSVDAGTTNGNSVQLLTSTGVVVVGTDSMAWGAAISTGLTSTAAQDASYGTADAAGNGATAARHNHTHRVKQDTADVTSLTNGNVTVAVAAGRWFKLPASTLSGAHSATLSVTGATAGDVIEITRLDATANAYTIIDGGPGTPNLVVMPASKVNYAKCAFDGTNWFLVGCGTQ